jgi:hypothetical protein
MAAPPRSGDQWAGIEALGYRVPALLRRNVWMYVIVFS